MDNTIIPKSTRPSLGLLRQKHSNTFDVEEDKTISFEEFRMLMAEAHVIDNRVNGRVLKTLYMQSMQFSYSIKQSETDVFRNSTQQVFIEFLEALSRVAVAKYGDNGTDGSLEKSLRRILKDHLIHLDPKRVARNEERKNNENEGTKRK